MYTNPCTLPAHSATLGISIIILFSPYKQGISYSCSVCLLALWTTSSASTVKYGNAFPAATQALRIRPSCRTKCSFMPLLRLNFRSCALEETLYEVPFSVLFLLLFISVSACLTYPYLTTLCIPTECLTSILYNTSPCSPLCQFIHDFSPPLSLLRSTIPRNVLTEIVSWHAVLAGWHWLQAPHELGALGLILSMYLGYRRSLILFWVFSPPLSIFFKILKHILSYHPTYRFSSFSSSLIYVSDFLSLLSIYGLLSYPPLSIFAVHQPAHRRGAFISCKTTLKHEGGTRFLSSVERSCSLMAPLLADVGTCALEETLAK